MMAKNDLTAVRLHELLAYEPQTGAFTWQFSRPKAPAGAAAGARQKIGYTVIRVDGRLYYAHRLAWLHMTGEWPAATVDHIDGDKTNNRWLNLRDVEHVVNCANQHRAQGSSGMLGAAWSSRTKNWRGIITRGDKQFHLGTFATSAEANAAYLAAHAELDAGIPLTCLPRQ